MKKSFFYRGRRISSVGFFGLGKSNLALFDYLSKKYDSLSFTLRSDRETACPNGFEQVFIGAEARENFREDVLFFSPSVRRDSKEFSRAEADGVILSSDVEFFFENKTVPTLAVTGTDGKSTTSALASSIMSENGDFPASANIGLPVTTLLDRKDIRGTVTELSSFQLMNFAPHTKRALITNVSENHLDFHTTIEEYALAKENILKNTEQRIFNLDCPYNRRFLRKYPAYAVYSTRLSYKEMQGIAAANHYFSTEGGKILSSGEVIAEDSPLGLPGEYNLSNFLAALSLSFELVPTEKIINRAKGFSGLSHRIKKVGEWRGISFYDSSIDSTPKRTITTLKAIKSPTVLLLGGRGKALSYEPLRMLPKTVRAVVLSGENKWQIFSAIKDTGARITVADSFDEAVLTAIKTAVTGDAVLLSPASTSFDSFESYAERGLRFTDLVKKYYAEK